MEGKIQYIIKPFNAFDTEATCVVTATMVTEVGIKERIMVGDFLKIDSDEYMEDIRRFNGIPYAISNFAAFRNIKDANIFIEQYLYPQTVAAKLRGIKFS